VLPQEPSQPDPIVGFVETFDGGTGLDRFDTGIYHRDEVLVANVSWSGDHDEACGSPDTQRPIHRDAPAASFYLCRDHIMTSIGDTAGYSTGWFAPTETFVGATEVSWEVNLTDLAARQWWEVSIVPADFDSGVAECPQCSVVDWLSPDPSGLPPYPVGSVVVGNGPYGGEIKVFTDGVDREVAPYVDLCSFDAEACESKAIRRPFSVVDNLDGTITVSFGGFETFTVPGSFPSAGFNVIFKDHNYTPDKDGVPVGHTWHWDTIVIA
jgi:hypothetical protein